MSYIEDLFSVKNKRVLIIGGSGVLGSSIAEAFVKAEAKVAITSTQLKKAESVAQRMSLPGNQAQGFQCNSRDKESLISLKDKVVNKWGNVDVLINAAGGNDPKATVMPEGSLFEADSDIMANIVHLNLFGGAILPIQVLGEVMTAQESDVSIINISSMSAITPLTRVGAYSAAKAAVDNFTKWAAVEFAIKYGQHIRVNAIAPGFFLTEQNKFLLTEKDTGNLTTRGKSIITHTPMGDFGNPEELHGVCLWLASSASQFVTGIVVPVDGGFSAFCGV